LLSLLFSVALSSLPQGNDVEVKLFTEYMRKYHKNYVREELGLRYENFKASIARVAEKNKLGGAVYGITKFSDLSPEEFSTKILMKNKITPTQPKEEDIFHSNKVVAVPDYFDWRNEGAVTPVKNQEQCGSCWAFSTTENVESMWILAGKGTNSTVDFAPQQIVDCDNSDDGCGGGDPPTAYDYLISAGGIESEANYPYTAEDGTCKFNAKEVEGKITNWQYACSWEEEATLQTSLLQMGPVSICVDASAWQDYESGVMTWEECAYINLLDHCVQLVGYNTVDSSNPYWMVRNSWGTDWGIDGYIWLEMWEDTCGLTEEATCSIV